jgi:hypothetical protein
MKKKEYDAYVRLVEITYGIRNVELRENQGENIEELDALLEFIDEAEAKDWTKKAKELKKLGVTPEVTIKFKSTAVTSFAKLPKKVAIGTCVFAEQESRYYVRGKAKWTVLPWIFRLNAASNKNKISADLFELD